MRTCDGCMSSHVKHIYVHQQLGSELDLCDACLVAMNTWLQNRLNNGVQQLHNEIGNRRKAKSRAEDTQKQSEQAKPTRTGKVTHDGNDSTRDDRTRTS